MLGDAQSALIDANQVLGQIDVSGLTGDEAGMESGITTLTDTQGHAPLGRDARSVVVAGVRDLDSKSGIQRDVLLRLRVPPL